MTHNQEMKGKNYEARYWDKVAKRMAKGHDFDVLLAEQYRRVHLNLISRWVDITLGQRILKTDLFAEAIHPSRAFFWDILKTNSNVVGIDISAEVTFQAKAKAAQYAPDSSAHYISCDVRQLPLADNSFDLIVSDSTLDHFQHENEITIALSELSRVLKSGGTLIVTMDNKGNLTEPLFRLWIALGLYRVFVGKTYSIRELRQALAKVGLKVMDSTAIIHNPRFFVRGIITFLRKFIHSAAFDHWLRRSLSILDSLETRKTKYLTGQFIAAKAVKPMK